MHARLMLLSLLACASCRSVQKAIDLENETLHRESICRWFDAAPRVHPLGEVEILAVAFCGGELRCNVGLQTNRQVQVCVPLMRSYLARNSFFFQRGTSLYHLTNEDYVTHVNYLPCSTSHATALRPGKPRIEVPIVIPLDNLADATWRQQFKLLRGDGKDCRRLPPGRYEVFCSVTIPYYGDNDPDSDVEYARWLVASPRSIDIGEGDEAEGTGSERGRR